MEFHKEVSFVNNKVDGSVGGAIYLLASSQMFLEADAHLKFINNTGRCVQQCTVTVNQMFNTVYLLCRSGAAIVDETPDVLSLFNRHFHNPFCFLQYYNPVVPLSEINHNEVCIFTLTVLCMCVCYHLSFKGHHGICRK